MLLHSLTSLKLTFLPYCLVPFLFRTLHNAFENILLYFKCMQCKWEKYTHTHILKYITCSNQKLNSRTAMKDIFVWWCFYIISGLYEQQCSWIKVLAFVIKLHLTWSFNIAQILNFLLQRLHIEDGNITVCTMECYCL